MTRNPLLLFFFITLLSCTQKQETAFSEAALNDTFTTLQNDTITLQNILKEHQGKKILIDVWASWCSDCIKGMPKVKRLQEQFPEVAYVFLSLDRGVDNWKKGIKKYNVTGTHYYMQNGKKCDFAKFIDIDWIPRYMVIDEQGKIKVFKAIEADDAAVLEALR